MNVDLWLARTFSILVAFTSLGVAYGAGVVFKSYYMAFKDDIAAWKLLTVEQHRSMESSKPAFNTHAIVIITVAVALECILWAVLNVGQAFELVVDGWGAIVGIIGTLILPLVGYKSIQNITASKGNATVQGGGS